jgi:hypothetical protein
LWYCVVGMASSSSESVEQENVPSPVRLKRKPTYMVWNEFNRVVLATGELKAECVCVTCCLAENQSMEPHICVPIWRHVLLGGPIVSCYHHCLHSHSYILSYWPSFSLII